MSEQGYDELKSLNRKIDELISNYNSLREECRNLKSLNESLKIKVQSGEEKMKELENKYVRVKLSGALLGDGENAIEAKRKITELVREIDKCIALLDR